jgi:hypothetical protein
LGRQKKKRLTKLVVRAFTAASLSFAICSKAIWASASCGVKPSEHVQLSLKKASGISGIAKATEEDPVQG